MGRHVGRLFAVAIILLIGGATVSGCGSGAAIATPSEAEHGGGIGRERSEDLPDLSPVPLDPGEKLKVIATTSIVGDVVKNVGGDAIDLTVLMPPGVDPHSYEPTPQDMAAVADAHVVFANGAGLEEALETLFESSGATSKAIHVSQGVQFREVDGEAEHVQKDGDADRRQSVDPHTWTDPNNVMVWTRNIEYALSSLDPLNAETFKVNAEEFDAKLVDLDAWIRDQVVQVPKSNREIVADHATLGYFVDRYGLEMVGTVIPGHSTLSEPSARELAELQDTIRDLGVKAVFVGNSVNPGLARRITEDLDIELVVLYTGSLSRPDGPANSYLAYMRYNVSQMVAALK